MLRLRTILILMLLAALGTGRAAAQLPGGDESRLGPLPGEGAPPEGMPKGNETPLQGGMGPGFSRAPSAVTRPGERTNIPETPALSPITETPSLELPLYGSLDIPAGAEASDEGPADGLTLDQAIDRMVHENLDLKSKFLEIPQAQADILTASLRANPVLYYDAQLIPYGSYSEQRPGGQTQYDLNVTIPLDLNHKRRFRTEVATRAKRVVEAQYQDAVRQQIGNLYTAYVDVLAARETVRYARASIRGLDRILQATKSLRRGGELRPADVSRVEIQRDAAQVGLAEAEETLREARRALVPLLNLRLDQAERLELRGSIRDQAPPPPPADELIRLAMEARPDLAAFRLGIQYAQSDVRLAQAQRFQDVFLLVQPYTFQDNSTQPVHLKSAHSWAVGLTVPLPIFDRNQGRIQRAQINVRQTQIDLATLEQQVATEVRQTEGRFAMTRASALRIQRDLLPMAIRVRDDALRRYRGGETPIVDFLNAQREYNDLVRQYRDTLIRHRRNMLDLNTAVGQRILP